jgi:hypothetical protein
MSKSFTPENTLTRLVEFGTRSKTFSAYFKFGPICRMNKCVLTRSINTNLMSNFFFKIGLFAGGK